MFKFKATRKRGQYHGKYFQSSHGHYYKLDYEGDGLYGVYEDQSGVITLIGKLQDEAINDYLKNEKLPWTIHDEEPILKDPI